MEEKNPMRRLFAVLLMFSVVTPAAAGPGFCPTESDREVLHAFSARLAAADDVHEAKDLALKKVRLGHTAIRHAERLSPDAEGLAEAKAEFAAFEATVVAASTPDEVAGAFDALMPQGDPQAMSCDYSTVELVLVVIGLVLGIIPGLLFLLIFC